MHETLKLVCTNINYLFIHFAAVFHFLSLSMHLFRWINRKLFSLCMGFAELNRNSEILKMKYIFSAWLNHQTVVPFECLPSTLDHSATTTETLKWDKNFYRIIAYKYKQHTYENICIIFLWFDVMKFWIQSFGIGNTYFVWQSVPIHPKYVRVLSYVCWIKSNVIFVL